MSFQDSCPTPDCLEKYRNRDLDAASVQQIELHLATCGLCFLLAQRLEDFHSVADSPELPHCDDWERLQPQIDERFHRELQGRHAASVPPRKNLRYWFWQPALAWGFALLLAYPAWLGITRPRADSAAPAPAPVRALPAQFLDLNVTRDAAAPGPVLSLRPGSPVVLGFFAAVQPGRTYTVSLTHQSGTAVFRNLPVEPNDDKGNFYVHCDSTMLPPGSYTLTFHDSAAPDPPRQFEFTVR